MTETDATTQTIDKPQVIDEFSDEAFAGVSNDINILEVSLMSMLAQNIMTSLKIRAGSTVDIKTVKDLRRRIVEYVHMHSLESIPLKLGTICRRFNIVAKKLGTDVSTCIELLIKCDYLVSIDRGGKTGIVSGASHRERQALLEEDGESIDSALDTMMLNLI